MKLRAGWIAVAIVFLTSLSSFASPTGTQQAVGDWTQWRGPGRDGLADASYLPEELPATLTRVWQVPIGVGHSSPVVVGDIVYLHSREGEHEIVRSVSLVDGGELWRQTYDAPFTVDSAARSHGPGPKSTPVYNDGRVYTFGIGGVLSAFDATDGTVLWRHDFVDRFPETAPVWGVAMSPIAVGATLVAHVGWDELGELTAFDLATGEPVWRNDEFIPGYASPVLVDVAGTRMIVTQADKHIIAVDPADGSTLWRMPFATDFRQNAVTPVAYGDGLVLSGLDLDLFAVALAETTVGEGTREASSSPVSGSGPWTATELWRNERLPLYMSSPVRVGERLFGMSHKRSGQFAAVDLGSGQPIWASRGREGESAAIVALGDRVVFLTDEARMVIVRADADAFEPLAEYEVAETPTWAHPVFTPRGVLIKDLETVTLWSF